MSPPTDNSEHTRIAHARAGDAEALLVALVELIRAHEQLLARSQAVLRQFTAPAAREPIATEREVAEALRTRRRKGRRQRPAGAD